MSDRQNGRQPARYCCPPSRCSPRNASADTTDDALVAALAKQGIVVKDRDTTIAMAHSVCAGFDKRYKPSVLAVKLVRETDLSLKQSGYFIGVAVSAYCPHYAGPTDTSANWLNPSPPLM